MKKLILILAIAITGMMGCGPVPTPGDSIPSQPQSYSTDGIKLISPEIHGGQNPDGYQQDFFTLHENRRLLVRYESLKSHSEKILTDNKHKVQLQLKVRKATDTANALTWVHAYPLRKNWMMAATWNNAHPFGGGGWSHPGGDYDSSYGFQVSGDVATGIILIDVTEWFKDFVKGRGENFGLLVLADHSLEIHGDNSGQGSPRMLWDEKP